MVYATIPFENEEQALYPTGAIYGIEPDDPDIESSLDSKSYSDTQIKQTFLDSIQSKKKSTQLVKLY